MITTPTRRQMLTQIVTLPLLAANPQILHAAPQQFRLDALRSQVGFSVVAAGEVYSGTMPVVAADMVLDFGSVANSRVDVTLRPADAQMGFVFATQALKSAEVLDTANHPLIAFQSTDIRAGATPSEAVVTGRVNVRGISQPVTLDAQLSQDASSVGDSNPELTLLLTGALDRHAFGASGYRGLVGPTVSLRIVARISRAG